ncbi:excinuclease ABC subunit UvrC [Thiolapillus sp.]|uniref:excinuclease ABC subunit UvrC n=3 Tax=Thiolapillus sp. TaxID=2017437 RepID=UPI003AF91F7D
MTKESPFDYAAFLKTLTQGPGVYRMLDKDSQVLYVGKAKNLKRRVSSYFQRSGNLRIQTMVSRIRSIEITVTHTEAEALLLENNLIKELKPRYNILLRDDKSYPYIYLSDDEYPRISFYRGARKGGGRYFGPYPSSAAVKETLYLLQKLFPVRQCKNSYYNNRSRACLQYQIKRCTGPCVGLIVRQDYMRDVQDIVLFLEGKTRDVVNGLVERMEKASAELEFEQAARYRDQIEAIRKVQERQYVSGEKGDLDIVACAIAEEQACVQVFFIRQGRNLGNKQFFPRGSKGREAGEVLSAFIAQYYLGKQVPAEILVSHAVEDQEVLELALGQQSGRKVHLRQSPRGERARWLKMAVHNAEVAMKSRLPSSSNARVRIEALQDALGMDEPPERMGCFDISHTAGERTVASCVVFNAEGPLKSDYRRFNIKGITPGDDYAAMAQALQRRYTRILAGEGSLPDILFIDGGKGQLSTAAEILADIGVYDVLLVGVAKGPERRAGMEQLFLLHRQQPLILDAHSPALHLIQHIRDEAHRFAITGHRQRRNKARTRSVLEDIPGIGQKRRQNLLKQFGGLQGLSRAGVEDIATVDGISSKLAEKIYQAFHGA